MTRLNPKGAKDFAGVSVRVSQSTEIPIVYQKDYQIGPVGVSRGMHFIHESVARACQPVQSDIRIEKGLK